MLPTASNESPTVYTRVVQGKAELDEQSFTPTLQTLQAHRQTDDKPRIAASAILPAPTKLNGTHNEIDLLPLYNQPAGVQHRRDRGASRWRQAKNRIFLSITVPFHSYSTMISLHRRAAHVHVGSAEWSDILVYRDASVRARKGLFCPIEPPTNHPTLRTYGTFF